MPNPDFIIGRRAGADITAFSIVKPGTNDFDVILASAATDKLVGVSMEVAPASGEPADIVMDGIARVKMGGIVAAGDFVTADSSGFGVKCNPSTGTVARYIGVAQQASASGDIIDVLVMPGQLTTP